MHPCQLRAEDWGPGLPSSTPGLCPGPMSFFPCQVERPFSPVWRVKWGQDSVCDHWCLEREGLASCLCPLNPAYPPSPSLRKPTCFLGSPRMPMVCTSQINSYFPTVQCPGPTLSACDSVELATHSWCLRLTGVQIWPFCVFHLQLW